MTVSMIVSQLAGRAPRVYSRRLNNKRQQQQQQQQQNEPKENRHRRLSQVGGADRVDSEEENEELFNRQFGFDEENEDQDEQQQQQQQLLEELLQEDPSSSDMGLVPVSEQMRRKLLFSIEWDVDNSKMTDTKKLWAALRTEAVNALTRYFGSINAGSIGWCEGTQWYNPKKKEGKCGTYYVVL
jgi:hypothetical protein